MIAIAADGPTRVSDGLEAVRTATATVLCDCDRNNRLTDDREQGSRDLSDPVTKVEKSDCESAEDDWSGKVQPEFQNPR